MTAESTAPAPVGDLASFAAESFTHDGVAHQIFRKGGGPAVIVITEMPGISPQVLGLGYARVSTPKQDLDRQV